jgi:hypothetical protein
MASRTVSRAAGSVTPSRARTPASIASAAPPLAWWRLPYRVSNRLASARLAAIP